MNSVQHIEPNFYLLLLCAFLIIVFSLISCLAAKKVKRLSSADKIVVTEDPKEIIANKQSVLYDCVISSSSPTNGSIELGNDVGNIISNQHDSSKTDTDCFVARNNIETSGSGNNMYTQIKNVPQKEENAYLVVNLDNSLEKYDVVNGDIVRKQNISTTEQISRFELFQSPPAEIIPIENSGNSSYYACVSEKPKVPSDIEVQENSAGSSFYASCGPVPIEHEPHRNRSIKKDKKEDPMHSVGQKIPGEIPKRPKSKEDTKEQKGPYSPKQRFSRVHNFLPNKKKHLTTTKEGNSGYLSNSEALGSKRPNDDSLKGRLSGEGSLNTQNESSPYSEEIFDFGTHQHLEICSGEHIVPPPPPSVDRLKHITEKKTRSKSKPPDATSLEFPKDAKEEVVESAVQEDDKYSRVDEQIKKKQDSTQDVVFEMPCNNSDILTEDSLLEEIKYVEIDKKSLTVESEKVVKDIRLLYAVVDKSKKKMRTAFPENLNLPDGDTPGLISESSSENKTVLTNSEENSLGDSQTSYAINFDENLASYAEITSSNTPASFSAEISDSTADHPYEFVESEKSFEEK